jgi:hypothetical protein
MNMAISLLGSRVTDRVNGFEGVVCSVSFDLSGCIQAFVVPQAKDGKRIEGEWYDVKRLTESGARVMDTPKFALELGDEPGGQSLPHPPRKPAP